VAFGGITPLQPIVVSVRKRSDQLAELMETCFRIDPARRPTAKAVYEMLSELHTNQIGRPFVGRSPPVNKV